MANFDVMPLRRPAIFEVPDPSYDAGNLALIWAEPALRNMDLVRDSRLSVGAVREPGIQDPGDGRG